VTLSDTGPLVAIINSNDPEHARCTAALPLLRKPLLTTEACLTETLHLVFRGTGRQGQEALWRLISNGTLRVLASASDGPLRARAYMERFRDQPCDYADATLLIAAEATGIRRVFTIDRHFHAYRLTNGDALEVVPQS